MCHAGQLVPQVALPRGDHGPLIPDVPVSAWVPCTDVLREQPPESQGITTETENQVIVVDQKEMHVGAYALSSLQVVQPLFRTCSLRKHEGRLAEDPRWDDELSPIFVACCQAKPGQPPPWVCTTELRALMAILLPSKAS